MTRTFHITIICIDILYTLFIGIAIYHLAHKPDLPTQYQFVGSPDRIYLDGNEVKSSDQIEFILAGRHIGDTITMRLGSSTEARVQLVRAYTPTYIITTSFIAFLFMALGLVVYILRHEEPPAVIF